MSEVTIGGGATAQDGDNFSPSNHLGKLVMFCGHEKKEVETSFGDATIAEVSLVAVLDGDGGVETWGDAWIFGAGLAPTIYRSPNEVVVGVIGQGEAKPGKSAPWTLQEPSEAQLTAAREWFPKFVVTSGNGVYFYRPDEAPF